MTEAEALEKAREILGTGYVALWFAGHSRGELETAIATALREAVAAETEPLRAALERRPCPECGLQGVRLEGMKVWPGACDTCDGTGIWQEDTK